ncbi:porin [Aquisalimonas asiatica]|uniref:Outer membrane protein (Porin) n=1 Tax=Aquisalimonas asiatica TaxID=406100 RepID=A0A1H8RG43_9GAMM|nr:porin [Aquisalimonas asiatica]SEO65370.1 Outer membrane protein (porin) [Aquisalimonas asiatica]
MSHNNTDSSRTAVALLTAALCAAPAAVVADDRNDVELYGEAHLSLNYFDTDNSDADDDDSGFGFSSNASRFGIRGSRLLDSGLTAIYQLELEAAWSGESGTDDDGNDAVLRQVRDSFVGVEGDFGMVRAGRLPAANQFIYESNYMLNTIGDVGSITSFGIGGRFSGAVQYVSPDLGPVNVSATVAPEGSSGDSEEMGDHDFLVRGTFSEGPWLAALTFVQVGADDDEGNGFDVYALGLGFERDNYEVGTLFATRDHDADDRDDHVIALGGSVSLTPVSTIRAQAAQFLGDADDADSLSLAVGYFHQLADNTEVYGAYARTDNDDAQEQDTFGYGHGGTPANLADTGAGSTPQGVSVGVHHRF